MKKGLSKGRLWHVPAVLAFLTVLISTARGDEFTGNAAAFVEAAPGESIYMIGDTVVASLGDTVKFQIRVEPRRESISSWAFHLDVDDAVFLPVAHYEGLDADSIAIWVPFTKGPGMTSNATLNSLWGDTLGAPDLNGIPGYQLAYGQVNTGAVGVTGTSLVAAYFELVVVGFPGDGSGVSRITWVDNNVLGRNTLFFREGDHARNFSILVPLDVLMAAVLIYPPIPDTVLTPGSGLDIWLGQHYFSQFYDSTEATWSHSGPPSLPTGATCDVTDMGDTYKLTVTTTVLTHGIITDTLRVDIPDPRFWHKQPLKFTIDYPPIFNQPLPDTVAFDEDVPLRLVGNTGFFSDQDDFGLDLQVRLEPDTYIHVSYTATDSIIFYADTNWFGSYPARLFVEDALGISADTLLTFTVNAVNDPPVVNFDSVSALGDTVVIHRAIPDTLDLSLFVTDVDDAVLSWSVSNPDPTNLTDTLLTGNRLRLLAADNAAYVDIALTLTAEDTSGAQDSDTLVVSIRSWPPDIIIVEDIKINSRDAPSKHLNLADWVIDLDTPPAAMAWSFRAVDAVTGAIDPYVTFAPNNPLTGDTVNIGVTQIYSAIDLLEMTVTDDAENTDIDTARLFIFDSDAPMIYPLPGLTIYRDTTYAGIIDLDDYVADLQDDPEDISWTFTGGDSLASFSIDSYSHEVTIKTSTTFIGNLIVSLIATNSRGLRDTSDLAILVSRRVDGPPLWYAVPDEVEVVCGWTTDLFTFGQVCFDETPTDQIDFTPIYNTDSLTVLPIVLPDSVKLETPIPDRKYTAWLYFTAEDEFGQISSSDTIIVHVKDSFSPDWDPIPNIHLNVGETYSGLFLRDYVYDRDTPDNDLTIEVVNVNPYIDVSYDSVTTELTVSAGSRTSDSRLIITATDDKGNTATTLLHVIVFAGTDYTPPAGGLTYFFNPATDRWIHYVVTADSSTDISRFTWHYAYGSPPRDWSDHLSFVMKDTLPGTVTWIAPYHFQNEGSYALSVEITDAANNMLDPSPSLLFSVGFSKAIGGVLASPDQQLTVSYPPALIPNGKLLIISEDTLPDSAGQPTAKIAKARANEEAASLMPATVYALDTNLPEPILVTLTYHQNRDVDPYYSFYEVDGDQLLKIETYAGADGQFEAAVTLGKDVVFASSDTPARNTPLPDAELFCYPNPFNATIQVRFLLRWPDRGRIVIYNLLGREVYASPRQPLEAGVHAFSWHGIDRRGLLVPSGAYFIRLETDGGKLVTRKVTLLK